MNFFQLRPTLLVLKLRPTLLVLLMLSCDDKEPTCADWLICYERCKGEFPEDWPEIGVCMVRCPNFERRYETVYYTEMAAQTCEPDNLRAAAAERASCVGDS